MHGIHCHKNVKMATGLDTFKKTGEIHGGEVCRWLLAAQGLVLGRRYAYLILNALHIHCGTGTLGSVVLQPRIIVLA